jgi:cytidine deaminase
MDADALIGAAEAVLNPQTVGDRLFGDVACALVTDRGTVFTGVCIDTASGTGFCAEAAAIAAVVTAGELKIRRIVAVWKDDTGALYVLSPCGRCREFIHQMHRENIETEVVLARDRVVPLRDLLPQQSLFTPAGKSENSRLP